MTKFAKTYGTALFDLVSQEGVYEDVMKDLSGVESVISACPDYLKMLSAPALTTEEKEASLDEAWKDCVHRYTLNFLKLVTSLGKAGEISDCIRQFRILYNEAEGISEALAVSAVPLTQEQTERLKAALEKKTGKRIDLRVKVDGSLIGGMRLEVDGKEFDNSVAYHLGAIKKLLKTDQIPQ